jgi:hypothetical protein
MSYSVLIIDMAHYGDPAEERTVGGFETFEAAKAYARLIVGRSVEDLRGPGQPAEHLRLLWRNFGEDAFVVGGEERYAGSRELDHFIEHPEAGRTSLIKSMRVKLLKLAHARSGDKGDTANVGLIALREELYPLLVREVTAERVKEHFRGLVRGVVERFELPNLGALNFLLHESLGGGGTLSLMTDAQGKTFSTALLRMEINLPDEEARSLGING